MSDATLYRSLRNVRLSAEAAVSANELRQLAQGFAGAVADPTASYASGETVDYVTDWQVVCPKGTAYALLNGGRAYWDYTNSRITFKRTNNSRDFYVGRIVGDAAQADTTCSVMLGVDPAYDFDLARDPFVCVTTGTQALGGFLPTQQRGGLLKLLCSTTNEVQKTDALAKKGFAVTANAIVEMEIDVQSVGSGSNPDFNVGLGSVTNATDADSIAQHLFCHMDGNATAIKFQSKDGNHTVAAADSTVTLTAGTPFEVWFDLRTESSVKIYIDGVRVLSSTTFDISAGTGSAWKLLAHLEKTSSADAFEGDVNFLRARTAKQ